MSKKGGLQIEQLESEFFARLADLAEFCAEADITQRAEMTVSVAIYLIEVIKRWQTPGITPEKVVEKSTIALERRMRLRVRKQGIEELRELLGEETDAGHGPGDQKDIGRDEGRPKNLETEDAGKLGEPVQAAQEAPPREARVPQDPPNSRREGVPEGPPVERTAAGRAPAHLQPRPPERDTPNGDDIDVPEGSMTERTCPQCRGPLGPELSNPKDPEAPLSAPRPCPACGWNPSSADQKPKLGPQPEKAGKSFSKG